MMGIDTSLLIFVLLAALAAGLIVYALMFDRIAGEKTAGRRLDSVKRAETDRSIVRANRDRTAEIARRRKTVQDSLKDLDAKQLAVDSRVTKPPLRIQLKQAGLLISQERFYLYSVLGALVLTGLAFFLNVPLYVLPGVFAAAALGLPRWIVSLVRKRRVKAFLDEFPNALDIIVRAVKSGLPLNDGIRLIASEAREPVRAEFRRIVEAHKLGISVPDAALRMPESMPCAEAGFFGIVIQIQSQAGGNLAEALGNLSRVLRDRKKMKAKVQALSMEARASAAIIGSLPFLVAFLVYLSRPDYIMPLFTTSTGHLILGVSAVWMSIGIFVMHRMMNFDV